jgi:hypothetical protein
VGEDGTVLGTFGIDSINGRLRGNPSIRLFDESGKEIWSAGGSGFLRKLGER